MPTDHKMLTGLTQQHVEEQRLLNGSNTGIRPKNLLLESLLSVVGEPMFILLFAACLIYFILMQYSEAFTMLAALLFVAGIDVFQSFRSQKAVKALSRITEKKAKVLREGIIQEIPIEEIVTKDIIICEEGTLIPADAEVLTSNDFTVSEAILTGESVSIGKFTGDSILQGTLVVSGYCQAEVKAVGKNTTLSGIGELVATTGKEKTPLQIKVTNFVRWMVVFGSIAFIFVWLYYWWESGSLLQGLLHGLTMAMSVLPEEIPVAFSTFMALGAYRLLKHGIIARSPKAVETLGAATVICLDKTGTLTQNLMQLSFTFDISNHKEVNYTKEGMANDVLEYAMWASEILPFDPMEISIHENYATYYKGKDKRAAFKMVKEFPLSGLPPVMTHVFSNSEGELMIGCKGGVEGVLNLCHLDPSTRELVLKKSEAYAARGFRVLGVAKGVWEGTELPELQEKIAFAFLGLIAFYDPPDPHIPAVIKGFYKAGVTIKMITGDYLETALAIAQQTGIKIEKALTGAEIKELKPVELKKAVMTSTIFARVSPEIKLKIIDALKESGEIVAMTGDGVNDGPALKSAHIGIAMGKRGTEVAKGAAGLVLSGDNLSKMIEALYLGRRINENLLKAIRYIISIHIPIILMVTMPIFFPWLPATLFSPVHVIFLELIMGPTCSIIYENEPIPDNRLGHPYKSESRSLLSRTQLSLTIFQGVMITLGSLISGYYAATTLGLSEREVRGIIFSHLIFSNIFLTLFNRSFEFPITSTIKMKNAMIPIIIGISLVLLTLILNISWLNNLFMVAPLSPFALLLASGMALLFTVWVEFFKTGKGKI